MWSAKSSTRYHKIHKYRYMVTGCCGKRLSRIITNYRLSQKEQFPLVKCIRIYCVKLATDHFGLGLA